MPSEETLLDAEERMEKAVSVFKEELRGLRTGRASPSLVVTLRIEYHGSLTPLKELAIVGCPDPSLIVIKPFDPGTLKDIEKAIRSSDLGMTPNNDGKLIRLQVPVMSGEQRKKLITHVKKSAESAKVACRNIRRDGNKRLDAAEKVKTITEDECDRGKEQMQLLLDKYEEQVEQFEGNKTKEIMDK